MKYSLILLFSLFTFFSTAQNSTNDSYLQVTRYKLQPNELNIQKEINAKKINLKIYYLENSSIVSDYHYFKPKKNEILFFFGKNKKTNKSEMYFKFDENLKDIYKTKDFSKLIKIVEVLKYNVFPVKDTFSSADAYAALENGIEESIANRD